MCMHQKATFKKHTGSFGNSPDISLYSNTRIDKSHFRNPLSMLLNRWTDTQLFETDEHFFVCTYSSCLFCLCYSRMYVAWLCALTSSYCAIVKLVCCLSFNFCFVLSLYALCFLVTYMTWLCIHTSCHCVNVLWQYIF